MIFDPASEELGQGFWPMVGAAVWGASMADAAYDVHRHEEHRPELGGTLSLVGAFGDGQWPTHLGLSGDVILRRGVSIGLDRVGFTPGADGAWDLAAGSRFMLASEGERWRPHALVGMGVRHGRSPGTEPTFVTRAVFSAGAGLRYYVVPRYFVEVEGRWEDSGEWEGFTSGVGMGIHLGR